MQWSLILCSDSRVNTQTRTGRAHARPRACNFIYFPAEGEGTALPEMWELLCVQACGFLSAALNCGHRLCIFARSRSTGRVWECLRNKPADVCVFFLIPLSLICTRFQQKKVAQSGQRWRKMPQSFKLSCSHLCGAPGCTKSVRNLRLHCELVHSGSIDYVIHINGTIFYLDTSQNHARLLFNELLGHAED